MKLLFLCKRRPQGRDLATRPYGRFYYLPRFLSERGHEVHVALLSYRNEPPLKMYRDGLTWYSETLFPKGPASYARLAAHLAKRIRPDWIIGFSDTWYGILAVYLGRIYKIRSCIDAYDNYESYIPFLLPLHRVWRKALSEANRVTAAGPHLADLMGRSRPDRTVHVVPMAADPIFFRKTDRLSSRKLLDLPASRKLIGYCGSIHRSRDIGTAFSAFERLYKKDRNIELVLSGRKSPRLRLPEGCRWMGYVSDEIMPELIGSLDVALVMNRHSAFGKFSYPAKLYEAMACGVPVIATDTPPTAWILSGRKEMLVPPENPDALAEKIVSAITRGRIDYGQMQSWEDISGDVERLLIGHR